MPGTDTLRQDAYSTRTAAPPRLVDRADPVVYGSASDGPFTAAELAAFERDGAVHRRFVTTTGETPDDHYKQSLRRQEIGVPDEDSLRRLVDEGRIEQLVGRAGSVVLFDCNVMHGSAGNITPFPRSNVFLVNNAVENALEEPFAAASPRPSFVAARDVEPLD